MAVRITNRAKKNIRNLYWRSTRNSIQRKQETKSLVGAMMHLIYSTPITPSNNNRGILGIWRRKGYAIYETTNCFVRYAGGIECKSLDSYNRVKRKWYFACFRYIRNNIVYIVNAVFSKYIDRIVDNTPTAFNFSKALKGIETKRKKKEAEARQLRIQFPKNESRQYIMINRIINECIKRHMYQYFRKNPLDKRRNLKEREILNHKHL